MLPLDARVDTVGWRLRLRSVSTPPWFTMRAISLEMPSFDPHRQESVTRRVSVRFHRDHYEKFMVIEASLARVCDGHNVVALPLRDVGKVMTAVEASLTAAYGLALKSPSRTLTRLDIVRDFKPVLNGSQHIRGLSADDSYRRTGSSSWTSHLDAYRGGGVSLYRGSADTKMVLYDKSAETRRHRYPPDVKAEALRLAEDRVRYELRLSARFLAKHALNQLDALTEQALIRLASDYFHLAQFGATVGGEGDLWQAIQRSDLTPGQRSNVWYSLYCSAHHAETGFSRNTNTDIRKLIRQHGFVWDMATSAGSRRLDFDLGTMIDD